MNYSIITLMTDFGEGSPYVAAMKGAILSINPSAVIVDITHSIEAQQIADGAFAWVTAVKYFPAHTIHVAIVDPGVGTKRALVYANIQDQHFLAPDNGLLHLVASEYPSRQLIKLTNSKFWHPNVSPTFHGRDILGPVAAHLSLGVAPDDLGERCENLVQLDWPSPRILDNAIHGQVVAVDSFGNLITNITAQQLPVARDRLAVRLASQTIKGVSSTYADQPAGRLLSLVGSSGWLEVAVCQGNAAKELAVQKGQAVVVSW